MLLFVFCFLAVTRLVYGALYTSPEQLPNNTYQYIVIGAGVGGGVVASRLGEDPSVRVLLVEAGPSDEGLETVEVPLLCPNLSPNTNLDWNFTTVPQVGLNNRSVPYPRGRLLGGSSSINFMAWTRGSMSDYNRIASVTEDDGWSWNSLVPFWKKAESVTAPADHHNTTGQFDPSVHGFNGPLQISLGTRTPLDSLFLSTTEELSEFPFVLDMNSGNPIGMGFVQNTIANGSRDSSARAYIHPALAIRPNLDVLINTQVVKLFQTGLEGGIPIVKGVQFTSSTNSLSSGSPGKTYTLTATDEVILSAGAVSTPQLLMLSGIGNKSNLESLGIKVLVDLPDVGQNLQDHPLVANLWTVNSSVPTLDDIQRNATLAAADLAQWEDTRNGPFSNEPATQLGWFRVPANASIFNSSNPDPSSGPNSPHFEMILIDGFAVSPLPFPATGRLLTIVTAVVTPSSRGTITLASTDPFDNPIIDPGLLSSNLDLAIMREAVKAARRFVSAQAWSDYIISEFGPFAEAQTDEELNAYIQSEASTIWHPYSTARMAPFNSINGVVNPDLTVKGIQGLRIVDASVLPFIPAAHPQASVYAVAERASVLIKNHRLTCQKRTEES
ncbi:hypothetical protein GYMLUDRAFT_220474 [Collybiopsis luxurians FD-317 M1]|nr:hypothetical protein GYMLUDRAFT_220474 [Collybiopsis luxurians FD-317 M1]